MHQEGELADDQEMDMDEEVKDDEEMSSLAGEEKRKRLKTSCDWTAIPFTSGGSSRKDKDKDGSSDDKHMM